MTARLVSLFRPLFQSAFRRPFPRFPQQDLLDITNTDLNIESRKNSYTKGATPLLLLYKPVVVISEAVDKAEEGGVLLSWHRQPWRLPVIRSGVQEMRELNGLLPGLRRAAGQALATIGAQISVDKEIRR